MADYFILFAQLLDSITFLRTFFTDLQFFMNANGIGSIIYFNEYFKLNCNISLTKT